MGDDDCGRCDAYVWKESEMGYCPGGLFVFVKDHEVPRRTIPEGAPRSIFEIFDDPDNKRAVTHFVVNTLT